MPASTRRVRTSGTRATATTSEKRNGRTCTPSNLATRADRNAPGARRSPQSADVRSQSRRRGHGGLPHPVRGAARRTAPSRRRAAAGPARCRGGRTRRRRRRGRRRAPRARPSRRRCRPSTARGRGTSRSATGRRRCASIPTTFTPVCASPRTMPSWSAASRSASCLSFGRLRRPGDDHRVQPAELAARGLQQRAAQLADELAAEHHLDAGAPAELAERARGPRRRPRSASRARARRAPPCRRRR